MKSGAHVKTSGGVDKAIERAAEIGAETIQIFSGAPAEKRGAEYLGLAGLGIGAVEPPETHDAFQVPEDPVDPPG